MKHLGDICDINGAEIEPVDCISYGAPCQDLSVAGLRKGMQHEDRGDDETTRSGLFYEAIRVIKEMRDADKERGRTDDSVRPRWSIYENVPGALSSNKGEDWRCVLEATAKIIEEDAVIPEPPKSGWPYAGSIILEHGSMAWRITDAQHWGVAQRRKRVCLLADFNGFSAEQILFDPQYRRVSEGVQTDTSVGDPGRADRPEVQPLEPRVSGDTEPREQAGQGAAGDTAESFGESGE